MGCSFEGNDALRLRVLRAVSAPIEDMTVAEISAAARIPRQRFYDLFPSKYDIAYWYVSLAESCYIYEIGRTLTLEEGLVGFFEFLQREHGSLANAFERNPDKRELRARLGRLEDEILWTVLSKAGAADDDMRFCISYTVESANCLVAGWCLRGTEEPRVMARRLALCIPQALAELAVVEG